MCSPLGRAIWALALVAITLRCSAADQLPGLTEISNANFTKVIDAFKDEYDWVVLEFYAHWCPACKQFQPAYIEVAAHIAALGLTAPRIAVARIDCADNQQLCTKFGISSYPSIFLGNPADLALQSSAKLTRIDPFPRTANNVIKTVATEVGVSLDLEANNARGSPKGKFSPAKTNSAHLRVVKLQAQGADLLDLEGALITSWDYLTTPVMLKGLEVRESLSRWLNLVVETHPVEACRNGAEAALEGLETAWPADVDDALSVSELRNIKICGKTRFKEWRGCKGSLPSSRGYTCGLWQTFHAMAAGLPEKDQASGARWLVAVRGFVKHFFQCSDCSKNFVTYASSPEAEALSTKRDAVLWMWKTHNKVNLRLKKEETESSTEDPEFPKMQWPPVEVCSACRTNGSKRSESDEMGEEEVKWDEGAVYSFLLRHYYSDAIKGMRAAGRKEAVGLGKHSGFYSSWGFAWMVFGAVAGGAYAALRRSGQYSYYKAMARKV